MRKPKGRRLIGREDALDRMIETCRAAGSGSAAVIEVTGAPGFGKSALLQVSAKLFRLSFPKRS